MEKILFSIWTQLKKIILYNTGIIKLERKLIHPWKEYYLLTDVKMNELKEIIEKNNIKLIILDMDGTLKHYKNGILEVNKKWAIEANKLAKVYIVTNSNIIFAKKNLSNLNFPYITSAMKPFRKSYKKILEKENVNPNEILAIGDDAINDIFGAHKMGITHTILLTDMNINPKKRKL